MENLKSLSKKPYEPAHRVLARKKVHLEGFLALGLSSSGKLTYLSLQSKLF